MEKLKNSKKYDFSLLNDLSLIDSILKLNEVEKADEELVLIKKVLEDEPELIDTLTDPDIKEEDKNKLIENIFKGNISDEMVEVLKKIFIKYTNVLVVKAITAVPMGEEAHKKLKEKLYENYDKDIILLNEIDKTIIGGVLLKVGDKVFDGTLQGELRTIKRTLKEVSL